MKEKFITISESQNVECLDESKFIKSIDIRPFYKINPLIFDSESIKAALDVPGVIQQWNDPQASITVVQNIEPHTIDTEKYVGMMKCIYH